MKTTERRSSAELHQERYAILREMLETRRREIQNKLHSILETLPEERQLVRDPEEQSVHDFVQAVDFTLMQLKSETLEKIDEALKRLSAGTYGSCTDCQGDIPETRLKALPFASRCVDCQERHETTREADVRQDIPLIGSRLREAQVLRADQEAIHD